MEHTNLLLMTDVYKFGHKDQYPKGTNKIYSYLISRGSRVDGLNETVFFGLQYYILKYLHCPNENDVMEFMHYAEGILGEGAVNKGALDDLVRLGYLPLEIKAVPEGTVMPIKNVLMTITNTHPDFAWLVNYVETLLMKIWNTITVASNSRRFKLMFEQYADETCDNKFHVPFQMHDFGYRGVSSEETAGLSGSAHLTNFLGTDTTASVVLLNRYYNSDKSTPINGLGLSVPASEHSVMCSWSDENDDLDAIKNMLKTYPTGIVSIVSDTYDLWKTITEYFGGELKDIVLNREGKTVIRPDSGDPYKIICGNPEAEKGSPESKGCLVLLDEIFGSTLNDKGYKVLNDKIGLIYGDGIFYERGDAIFKRMKELGFASSNIVFGSGGLLLQYWSRDTLKFAIKATYCEINGKPRSIEKMPITDLGKKSHRGLMSLSKENGEYITKDNCTPEEEKNSLLKTVYKDGLLVKETTISEIRSK